MKTTWAMGVLLPFCAACAAAMVGGPTLAEQAATAQTAPSIVILLPAITMPMPRRRLVTRALTTFGTRLRVTLVLQRSAAPGQKELCGSREKSKVVALQRPPPQPRVHRARSVEDTNSVSLTT